MKRVAADKKREIIKRVPLRSVFGGGTLPTLKIESAGIQIDVPGASGDDIYKHFLSQEIPIVGYILEDKFTLDMRTVFDDDIPAIAAAIDSLIK
jgi:L-seryl-tRNA(Ser) seleniumtransferase